MANETTTTSLNDLIHSEAIEQIVLGANRPAAIYRAIAWMRDASKAMSGVYKFPKWDKTDIAAGVKTEGTGSFTTVEQTTSGSNATAGVVGMGRVITEEAMQDSGKGLADMMVLAEEAGAERITKDLVGLFTSATNTYNFGNNEFNLTGWGTGKAQFKALNPRGSRLAFVGSVAAMRGLEADLRTTGAQILANPLYMNGEIFMQPGQGFKGFFEGYEIYETALCPDNDADTISSAFCVVGDQGALGLAVWFPFKHVPKEAPENANMELYTYARYAVAITNQSNLLEVITND